MCEGRLVSSVLLNPFPNVFRKPALPILNIQLHNKNIVFLVKELAQPCVPSLHIGSGVQNVTVRGVANPIHRLIEHFSNAPSWRRTLLEIEADMQKFCCHWSALSSVIRGGGGLSGPVIKGESLGGRNPFD